MSFIPDTPKQANEVPYFDDVIGSDGWQGHTTRKSLDTLKSEIIQALSRLGGLVAGFQRGSFSINEQGREGFRIHYTLEGVNGTMLPGRIDIAALPVKNDYSLRRSYDRRKEQSLKMALFMLRNALDGTWFLQQLSPGYAALMPWMLERGSGKTISELWTQGAAMGHLLPATVSDDDFEVEILNE